TWLADPAPGATGRRHAPLPCLAHLERERRRTNWARPTAFRRRVADSVAWRDDAGRVWADDAAAVHPRRRADGGRLGARRRALPDRGMDPRSVVGLPPAALDRDRRGTAAGADPAGRGV